MVTTFSSLGEIKGPYATEANAYSRGTVVSSPKIGTDYWYSMQAKASSSTTYTLYWHVITPSGANLGWYASDTTHASARTTSTATLTFKVPGTIASAVGTYRFYVHIYCPTGTGPKGSTNYPGGDGIYYANRSCDLLNKSVAYVAVVVDSYTVSAVVTGPYANSSTTTVVASPQPGVEYWFGWVVKSSGTQPYTTLFDFSDDSNWYWSTGYDPTKDSSKYIKSSSAQTIKFKKKFANSGTWICRMHVYNPLITATSGVYYV